MQAARIMSAAIVAFSVTLLAACQTNQLEPPPHSAADVVFGATLTADPYRGTSELSTPEYRTDWLQWFCIRRLEAKGEPVVHQLYVVNLAPDWYFLGSASDNESTPLQTVVIDRSVQRGVDGSADDQDAVMKRETIGVRLEPGYLSKHADTGISMRLYGKGGSYREVNVPGYFVQGYLDILRAHGVALDGATEPLAPIAGSR